MRKKIQVRSRCVALCVGAHLLAGATVAFAQGARSFRYNRPSDTSASTRVNRLGGIYTNDTASPLQNMRAPGSGSSLGSPSGVTRRLPTTGSLGMRMIRQQQGGSLGETVGTSAVVTSFRNQAIDSGEIAFTDMMISSGFAAATRADAPLRGWRFVPPRPTSPLYAVSTPKRSPFQEFFGLKSAESSKPNLNPMTLPQAMSRTVEQDSQRQRERAFALFKAGNYSDAGVCLEAVRRSDKTDYVAAIVSAHAALERREVALAVKCLVDAITRHPDFFMQRFDIREYYGDRTRAESTLRDIVRGASEGKSWPLMVLGVYAAWQLNDLPMARDLRSRLAQFAETEQSENAAALLRLYCTAAAVLDRAGG